ncbi:helicase [Vibrio phage pYD21-A]|uniref:helicase n=1 Tax=Vibrio phage pYD21-A TaxID=754049 RepID=UPI0002C070D9|nr:helicase [Vibrio phage pYD21-A]AGH16090.1 helicase [Vibrio phage pYD21-A]
MYELRPYQRGSVDAAISFMLKCLDPWLIEAATGAGKSLLVCEIAKWIHEQSGKKVLCLAPSKELVEQNRDKYLSYGLQASMWSASAGQKSLKHDVVFGTPTSVLNSLDKFGDQFAAVIIDEAHGITPTIKKIIAHIKEHNPRLRIGGLTATPYRLGSGYIYEYDVDNNPVGDECTKNPFFKRLIYRITAPELIEQGYLTPPVADAELAASYDTSGLHLKSNGKFDEREVEQAFEGHGRLTSQIVADVVANSAGKRGVMFFAATRQHAAEIVASLPPENTRMVDGSTKKKEREKIVNDFKAQKYKYLVNISVLTTGFDAPHVDVIAILRATESASLLQQIIGRGLRLHEGKHTCLVLDYAGNIERHGLEDDLFSPDVKVSGGGEGSGSVEATCKLCGTVNEFSARPNKDGLEYDDEGYFIDLTGKRVEFEGQFMPAHFGRRCRGGQIFNGHYEQCTQRWSMKICPECDTENDIAARYCSSCREELVDPNTKLIADYKKMKSSPRIMSTDKVLSWNAREWISRQGNTCLRVTYTTEYRTFDAYYHSQSNNLKMQGVWSDLCMAAFGKVAPSEELFVSALKRGFGKMPETITSKKEGDFFRVYAHNLPCEEAPE